MWMGASLSQFRCALLVMCILEAQHTASTSFYNILGKHELYAGKFTFTIFKD